jgi:hypothetical protein
MKLALVATVLFFASVSQAEVKEPGTFVPSLCSVKPVDRVKSSIVRIDSVCLGEIADSNQEAIQVVVSDGETRTYAVEIEKTPGRMGVTKSKFKGNVMTIKMMDQISGELTTTSGIRLSHSITLETATTNLTFSGPLEMVFVTQ